jgi:hypothetical protein
MVEALTAASEPASWPRVAPAAITPNSLDAASAVNTSAHLAHMADMATRFCTLTHT